MLKVVHHVVLAPVPLKRVVLVVPLAKLVHMVMGVEVVVKDNTVMAVTL
jgi:hypothetical protein